MLIVTPEYVLNQTVPPPPGPGAQMFLWHLSRAGSVLHGDLLPDLYH